MMNLPIGLSTGCFYDTPIVSCLERIRDAGFTFVEICSFPEHLDYHDQDTMAQVRTMMADLKLTPFSFHAPFHEEIDLTSPFAAVREKSIQAVHQACQAAAELGARHVVIHPGPESAHIAEVDRMERLDHGVATLEEVARHCQKLKIKLVLENMPPHLLTGPVQELMWILGALQSTDVGICLDTGHAYLSGDLAGIAHKLRGHISMVHVSDNRGEHDDHLPPGQGQIDWERFLKQLVGDGFNGMLILELHGGQPAKQILQGARQGSQLLQEILGQTKPDQSMEHAKT